MKLKIKLINIIIISITCKRIDNNFKELMILYYKIKKNNANFMNMELLIVTASQ